jgi:AcrR family transcriptional regulator
MRLLETGGLDALTTNAVAASAGISIGTLYQFFPNKEAILDTLADRETEEKSAAVIRVMEDGGFVSPEQRIAAVVQVVAASYGGRQQAHRLVMAHSLTRGRNRFGPLLAKMMTHLANERQVGPVRRGIGQTDAFVLAHAFGGVLRGMTSEAETAPPQDKIAQVLARLVVRFIN